MVCFGLVLKFVKYSYDEWVERVIVGVYWWVNVVLGCWEVGEGFGD